MKSDNKNFIIAIILTMGFLLLWNVFVVNKYAPSKTIDGQSVSTPNSPPPPVVTQLSNIDKPIVKSATSLQEIALVGKNEMVTISNQGGVVTSWIYKESKNSIQLIVPKTTPLALFPELLYAIEKVSDSEVILTAVHPGGFNVIKRLKLSSEPPFHQLSISFNNISETPVVAKGDLTWIGGIDQHIVSEPYDEKQDSTTMMENRAVGLATQVRSWTIPGFFSKSSFEQTSAGPFSWVGVDNSPFLVSFIPVDSTIDNIFVQGKKKTPTNLSIPIHANLNPKESKTVHFQLYVGPKSFEELKKLPYHLDKSIDFGFFGLIAKLLLGTLHFFYKWTGNFGWAIIIVTLLIQFLMIPLTKKNFHHAARMKELQPQLKKLQDQFKGDPKRMQIETMNLYRKQGMKFMGMEGCLPIILQIPVFFAFYSALRVAYELRGAPWMLWIQDLSKADPYYVLPILMGIGMFFQQKMSNATIDPAQAKVMMFMPIIFTFMFFAMPSGLCLYWVVNSLVTIVIQQFFKWRQSQISAQPA
ncbi:MAG: membrane protein insertase YidC [Elusimicrobiota bacterium]